MNINIIKSIVQKYPLISEKYLDFLSSLNISFDENNIQNTDLSFEDAEKFIVSYKLRKYLEKLNLEKREIISNALKNNIDYKELISEIDNKIHETNEKLELLLDMNNK